MRSKALQGDILPGCPNCPKPAEWRSKQARTKIYFKTLNNYFTTLICFNCEDFCGKEKTGGGGFRIFAKFRGSSISCSLISAVNLNKASGLKCGKKNISSQ